MAPPPASETTSETAPDPHVPLLTDVLALGTPYALALTGDYAVVAHGLADWQGSRDRTLETATEHPAPMEEIATALESGLLERGWQVSRVETDPLSTRLLVVDPATAEEHTLDIAKQTFWHPPVRTPLGPTASLEDVIGTKVRVLADRGLPRDLIDVHAAADRWTHTELEELGRRHALDTFDLTDLQSRLEGTEWLDDREFTHQGLDEEAILTVRQWAQTWADDIAERLLEEEAMSPPPEAE
ncbi:hypothetical protein SGFS_061020 [Streptomyces graminofaciens]|uniref:Nucleotidyltransferase AbiEii toxin of type IV toxin-antitoxin system n=1 Tax=Streptomyces graminofaciens TaxID=68212 RepID=A0ABM7FFL6_9ACTN|nr:nucleotidyl transferase AbiEii/AbiGii toxin family protein [Streptomyces graminofaciens]BBC34808.1 hypothetical protein SGFS_061020 [Streptomyces graminofaciens]